MTLTVPNLVLFGTLALGTALVSGDDLAKVDAGSTIVTVLPSRGRDVAVAGAARTTAPAGRLVAWARTIEAFYQGRYVAAIGRFSNPPRVEDLSALTLDEQDVTDLRRCRPGDCAVKLAAGEIEAIRRAAAEAGDRWRAAVQLAFKRTLVQRAAQSLRTGLGPAPSYADRRLAVLPGGEFNEIASVLAAEPLGAGPVAYFMAHPAAAESVESFLYWSKKRSAAASQSSASPTSRSSGAPSRCRTRRWPRSSTRRTT